MSNLVSMNAAVSVHASAVYCHKQRTDYSRVNISWCTQQASRGGCVHNLRKMVVWYLCHDKFILSTNVAVSVAICISSVATNIEQITVEYTWHCTHFFIISADKLQYHTKSPKMIAGLLLLDGSLLTLHAEFSSIGWRLLHALIHNFKILYRASEW